MRLQQRLEEIARRAVPDRGRPRVAARARSAGRLAGAVPRERTGPDGGARDRAARRRRRSRATPPRGAINFDWIEPAREVRIDVDQDEARLLGLSSAAVASVLNTAITGATVTQVRDDIYLIDVVARATEEERVDLSTLRHAAGAASRRAQHPADTVRDHRERPGVSAGLASRPRADADGAGRRGAGHRCPRRWSTALEPTIAALAAELPPGYADRARRHRRGEREVAARRCSPSCR